MTARSYGAFVLAAFVAVVPLAARADVTGVVQGRVTVDGTPRGGVVVTVRGEQTTQTARTDAAGRYTFPRIAFGRYRVSAHVDGEPDANATVDVTTDAVAQADLAITPIQQIGRTATTSRTAGGNPVSVTTLSQATIAALPQNQNLDRLIETVPGVVRFSYDEPVVHGFHGVSYEVDGAPVPQTTSSSFAQIIDPRNIDSMEIFTGAFPAEFGGQRMGALVNIVTKRDADIPGGSLTTISPGIGTYGTGQFELSQASRFGSTDLFFDANVQRTNRGLDSPTESAINDNASLSDEFFRTITRLTPFDTLAFDYSNQYNTYQIPINTSITDADAIVNLANQDDVQREYSTFGNLNYTHTSRDGSSYWQAIPWWRTSRIVFAADIQALDYGNATCGPDGTDPCPLAGLSQDRRATVTGLRSNYFHDTGKHALKFGIDGSVENFTSAETIVQADAAPFFDNVAQRGTTAAAYAEDKWTPSSTFSVSAGLRYDYSNGFVQGNQVEPRIGVNVGIAPQTIFHVYYGRLYAAPDLEDTRREAVVIGGGDPNALPVYDLKPQTESYYEAGVAHTFPSGINGYVNVWQRNVWNVLDTTQIYPTPIFAVYNNSLGLAHGYELRLQQNVRTASWFLSAGYSQSVAGGISGGTFIFCPPPANTPTCLAGLADPTLEPEDHDQAVTVNGSYTKHFGRDLRSYATLGPEYGTGYPVEFQNGTGRLTPHLTFDAAVGTEPVKGRLGYSLSVLNLLGYQYIVKINNGFNTTQWAAGAQVLLQLKAAL
jgi:outer membrane receptor protein involved in Fe transport